MTNGELTRAYLSRSFTAASEQSTALLITRMSSGTASIINWFKVQLN
jgi:hypothetical protein